MGLFGKRKSRAEFANDIMAQVKSGKGFYGRIMQTFVDDDDLAKMKDGFNAAENYQQMQAAAAAGVPTLVATVIDMKDTGQLINFDPRLILTVQLDTQQQIVINSVVSKISIPRIGDRVNIMAHPAQPGTYMFVGIAPPEPTPASPATTPPAAPLAPSSPGYVDPTGSV